MSLLSPLRVIATTLVEIIFPHCCIFCGRPFCLICNRCRDKLDYCTQLECSVYYPDLQLQAVCRFTAYSRKLIHRYKYAGIRDLGPEVAQLMYNSIQLPNVDYISAVPPDPHRKKHRGFDHTQLIAQELSLLLGVPYVPLLIKVRQTQSLASTNSKKERLQVCNPFNTLPTITELQPQTKVLLVDDVCTTGTTLRNCLKILAKNGIVGYCVVFALRV